ncbi:Icc protein [Modicisalibacter ilicicola DSM 19980]|uniref:Icc protein n=1 Tax=Modicisalibacter ilicicola DSM 19980 TaxID=1121942 RepID=A0A1M4SRE1_9GAMM|nr:metallophosphoesterase [Halomonas ilicicola]SHE34547.1 Icc protein [Halomonas ilicicola DSM 19980]
MRLIQITDCHLHAEAWARSRVGYPLRQLRAVIERAGALRPDVVLVSGDVSQDETVASYRLADEAFSSLGCFWSWFPGNHDQPRLMHELHEIDTEVDLGAWRLLILDSRVDGQAYGALGEAQLERLAQCLEEDDRPSLLAMHHPPVSIGSEWMDAIGLMDREAFWDAVTPYPQVRGVLCGHIHQALALRQGEVMVYGCPATTDQFLGGSPAFAVDEASRPGLRVVDMHGQRLSTWIERVEP